jgi:branched-chain amino acid transport system ATP-binding protein
VHAPAEAEPAAAPALVAANGASGEDLPVRHGSDGTGKPILQLDGIGLSFGGFRVLDEISLTFTEGERAAIIGPNGAGKTTLFNVISGIYKPSDGSIKVSGVDLTDKPTYARPSVGLARTFQVTKVFGPLTVRENMMLGLLGWTERNRQYSMHIPRDRAKSLVERTEFELERIGLADFANEEVINLSYGHQKQLDIGLALASEPDLLLLDEPTAGLSQSEASRMMKLVSELPSEITVLIIEHNLDFLFNLTDRLVVLESGKVLLDGEQHEVRRSEEVRKIYFGSRG